MISNKYRKKVINSSLMKLIEVDFGKIESAQDVNLINYFYDNDYYNSIINKNKFFILGRKGTGKTALYKYIQSKANTHNLICKNNNLDQFPYSKLRKFSYSEYDIYNKYAPIWEYIIYLQICKCIIEDQSFSIDSRQYINIKNYIDKIFKDNMYDYHAINSKYISEKNGTLEVPTFVKYSKKGNIESEIEEFPFENIHMVNSRIKDNIIKLLSHNWKNRFIIQFDGLDDNYSSENTEYSFFILGLLKTAYKMNNFFITSRIDVTIAIYLRSDIYSRFHELHPDSAKWENNILYLNWTANDLIDYNEGHLRKLMNKRIINSLENTDGTDPWNYIFNDLSSYVQDVKGKVDIRDENITFRYVVQKTMHRPRDVISYCIYLQEIVSECKGDILISRALNKANEKYSQWFWKEISNEINQEISDTDSLQRFLHYIRSSIGKMKYSEFEKIFDRYRKEYPQFALKYDFDTFSGMLYKFGILSNFNDIKKTYRSVYREENSNLRRFEMVTLNECIINMLKNM